MEDAIRTFAEQLSFEPAVENGEALKEARRFIVCGMGGSHLAADLIRVYDPCAPVSVHSDYGLPCIADEERGRTMIIASSYSGNTEETIDAFEKARAGGYNLAAVTTGGELLALAKKHGVPYVSMPATGIQPRCALGYSVLAIFKLMGREDELAALKEFRETLVPADYEAEGKKLAEALRGRVPVIYASARNTGVAYVWKIKFNETGKVPAFYNVVPELNHNEMNGYESVGEGRALPDPFHFLFLKDPADSERVQKRMEVMEKLYRDRGMSVTLLPMKGEGAFERIFTSLILGDWAAYHTALLNNADPEAVRIVEEFKRLIAS